MSFAPNDKSKQVTDPIEIASLVVALGDQSAEVRRSAAYKLGQIRDRQVVEPLIDTLQDTDENVVLVARYALIDLEKLSVPFLIQALKHPDSKVRSQVAYILGIIEDKQALGPLTEALEDEDFSVRLQVGNAIARIKVEAKRDIETLITVLNTGNSTECELAAMALGQKGEVVVSFLIDALDDPDNNVRWQIICSLKELKDERALPALTSVEQSDQSEMNRNTAADAIQFIKGWPVRE